MTYLLVFVPPAGKPSLRDCGQILATGNGKTVDVTYLIDHWLMNPFTDYAAAINARLWGEA